MSMKTLTDTQRRTIEAIRKSSRVYLGTHLRPDGDALGSLLGLARSLEKSGRSVAALSPDPPPETYRFLPGAARILADPPDWTPDTGLVVDCDGIGRLGRLTPVFAALPELVDIDHHATGQLFGTSHWVVPGAAATGEIIYAIIRELELPLDTEVATCLYTAILTDTGRFCFGNTTANALRVSADLVAAGADPHGIARRVYEERSLAATHLLGITLSRLQGDFEGQVISATLTQRDFAASGASPPDTEGIIDHLRAISGPRVALLFVQPNHDGVRVSLRSDGSLDVSRIALLFGGGGHAMAAGCTCDGTVEDVASRVLAAVGEALSPTGPG